MIEKGVRYFRDADHDDVIVRVWYEGGKRHGEMWDKDKKEWFEATKLAGMVADEIYDNHPLTEKEVKEIIGG